MFVIRNPRLRRFLRAALPFVLIPAVVALGVYVFDEKSYGFISLVVVILAMVLFCAGFEKRTVGTRRIIVIAVMTALSILGRFVFAPIPGFKPITAMIVITAIWLGGESGFLVGVLTVVISNFYFGQGPWTPFQMFAFGMIGLIAGFLAEPLKKSRVALALYGVFAGVAFSCIMDVWSVLWYENGFHPQLYWGALLTAVPYMFSYAVSNVIFLLLLGRPFGEKLERIKIKYGV
ncbi:MAG: ECF transporter S component [Oscillospiraceae bacterium]|nr:ECF transporter S component [Oscillospiraceae bacterium]